MSGMVLSLSHDRAAAKLGLMAATNALPLVTHWIDGKPTEGASARTGDVFDPATGRVTKQVAFASADDVDTAVTAATAAFAAWRSSSLAERTKVMFRFRELL